MDWLGRNQTYRSSSAWVALSPERDVKRPIKDNIAWGPPVTPYTFDDPRIFGGTPRPFPPRRGAVDNAQEARERTKNFFSEKKRNRPPVASVTHNFDHESDNESEIRHAVGAPSTPMISATVSDEQSNNAVSSPEVATSDLARTKKAKRRRHRRNRNASAREDGNGNNQPEAETAQIETTIMAAPDADVSILLPLVRRDVERYRLLSAFHFALEIHVYPSKPGTAPVGGSYRCNIQMTFANFGKRVHRFCRQHFRNGRLTDHVQVKEDGRWIAMYWMLNKHFPTSESVFTSIESLRGFWEANGKGFNWNGLPTELKENVVLCCIDKGRLESPQIAKADAQRVSRIQRYERASSMRPPSQLEVVLGEWRWSSLLWVSTVVREFTVRLCLAGSSNCMEPLCVKSEGISKGYVHFQQSLLDLNFFSQMVEPNSVPPRENLNDPGHLLRATYRESPQLYPELKRYATMFHGIRKVDISFGFVDFYRFFKVTAGGFDSQPRQRLRTMTCDVFIKMPFLKEIVVRLPNHQVTTKQGFYRGPELPLFDSDTPCHRRVNRILYEQIAKTLAGYKNVIVKEFLDEEEENRFLALRQVAVKKLKDSIQAKPAKLSVDKLLELNEHSNVGGIELPGLEYVSRMGRDDMLKDMNRTMSDAVYDFYPIVCHCHIGCEELFGYC